jgi:hypothetical protein
MNVFRYAFFLCLLALTSLVLAQSSVDGTWAGEVQGGRGPVQLTLTLKASGDKLTGSLAGGRGGTVMIEDGTVSGSTIGFKTRQQGRGGEVTYTWSGTVKGDEIAMTRDGGQGQQKFTLTRQKK